MTPAITPRMPISALHPTGVIPAKAGIQYPVGFRFEPIDNGREGEAPAEPCLRAQKRLGGSLALPFGACAKRGR